MYFAANPAFNTIFPPKLNIELGLKSFLNSSFLFPLNIIKIKIKIANLVDFDD
jgi:hypothetical protein